VLEMLAIMSRRAFETMDDAALIWACVEPVIAKIRGRDHGVKEAAYAQLTAGQRALMMFQVLRGHSSSGLEEFFRLVPHLPSREGIWRALRKAMRYFGDDAFAQLLLEIEADYRAFMNTSADAGIEGSCAPGNREESLQAVQRHDPPLREAISGAEGLIAARIRSDWGEFLELQA
jgi:hypothetical protein